MTGIDGGYKLSEFLLGRGGSADAIVNVAAVELRFWAVVLAKKLVFDKTYKKIGVAGSHFSTHGHAISLFVVVHRSDEGLTLETSAFLPFTVANLRFQPSC